MLRFLGPPIWSRFGSEAFPKRLPIDYDRVTSKGVRYATKNFDISSSLDLSERDFHVIGGVGSVTWLA